LVSGNPSAGPATFGTPIQLDLGGRGIRSIEKNAANQYLIVAGTAGGASNFALYSWTGNPASVPILRTTILTGLNPESIVGVPDNLNDAATLQLLSDNGDDVYYNDGVIAKELPNEQFKKFRSDIINLAAVAPVSISGRLLASATSNKPAVLVSIALVNTRTGERIGTTTDGRGNFVFGNASDGETYRIEVRRSLRPTQSLPFTINGGATNLIIALQ
jgi:hypothetical protein